MEKQPFSDRFALRTLITGVGWHNDSTESPHDLNQLSLKLKNYPFQQHRALGINIPMLLVLTAPISLRMHRVWLVPLAAALTSFIGV